MQKLINSVQNYAWGSKTALTELYGMENPSRPADGRAVDGRTSEKQFTGAECRRRYRFTAVM
ncbi:mannose-6-phosphate isomerase [Escherichia coli]|uniref:Mannose-6-phosphate isomerase n=1 Tax=Escherichia coli TaxID=562 RepID=A0A2X3K7B5_ECOLX|nr:mannose-6-phosphate isomerase [Escherichia coli]